MAIYSSVPPPDQQAQASHAGIEAWTVDALQSLQLWPTARGTGVSMAVPSQDHALLEGDAPGKAGAYKPRKEMMRRDSLRRREALLKGKEGSRRRQRWENDRLLHVPNVQPPLPSDWEVHPAYPVHAVPYYLAPLWDAGVRTRAEEVATARKVEAAKRAGKGEHGKAHIPQELKRKMKKSKGAKSLLMDLEEEVRRFVREGVLRGEKGANSKKEAGDEDEMAVDSEDEEIVFVGRNGTMSDEKRKEAEQREREVEKMVYGALADENGGSFGRWLVHSIADYYGLTSRSVTVGDPARREAYVGIKDLKSTELATSAFSQLPRPLWGMV